MGAFIPFFLKKETSKFFERKDQNEPNGTIDYVPVYFKKTTSIIWEKKDQNERDGRVPSIPFFPKKVTSVLGKKRLKGTRWNNCLYSLALNHCNHVNFLSWFLIL
jgi:hypothetical protein